MKKLLLIPILVANFVANFVEPASAQDTTNTPPPPPPTSATSFFQTATAYFTSFNTNAEMGWLQRGELSAGVASLQGPVNLANDLRLSYEVTHNFGLESVTRDSGIAGTWLSQAVGVNYAFKVFDAKLTLYGDGGYQFNEPDHRYFGELGLRVSKKMTRFTFAGVGIGAQIPTGRKIFTAFAGFTF